MIVSTDQMVWNPRIVLNKCLGYWNYFNIYIEQWRDSNSFVVYIIIYYKDILVDDTSSQLAWNLRNVSNRCYGY